MSYRILLVEDEESLREVIALNLEMEGYHVASTDNGIEAMNIFKSERFNLVILDVMLPKMNGLDLGEKIRLLNHDLPILFLSAKSTQEDRIAGLKAGGHDYLTKPFNLEELLLRVNILIKAGLKGTEQSKELNVYKFAGNVVDFKTYQVQTPKGTLEISKREGMLLKLLIDKKGEVVSREQILEKVWGYDVFPSTRTIDNFILNFRKNFEPDPKNPRYFHSVRGVGYKYTEDAENSEESHITG